MDALPTPVAAVVFDLDGTLLDTEPIYFAAYAATAAALGVTAPYTFGTHRLLLGRPEPVGVAAFLADLGLAAAPGEVVALRDASLRAAFPSAGAMPGAVALVEALHAAGVPLAIATASKREYMALKRSNNERREAVGVGAGVGGGGGGGGGGGL